MTDFLPLAEIEQRLRAVPLRGFASTTLPPVAGTTIPSTSWEVDYLTLAHEVARMLEESMADLTAERNATVTRAIARAQIAEEEARQSRQDVRALCESRDALETREERMLEEQRERDAKIAEQDSCLDWGGDGSTGHAKGTSIRIAAAIRSQR
mgnify:CR=1 FL=1